MLSMIVIDALVRFELSEPTHDTRTLYFAAFIQGLSFANQHVFALLMLAPAAPTLGRVFARRGFIGLMGPVAFPILGFSAYVYLPIRASQVPGINFGEASTLANLYWTLNEDPWWGPSYVPAENMLAQLWRGLTCGHVWIGLPLLLLAGLALWYSARGSVLRRFALLWLIVVCVPLASVSLLIRPRLTSDAWGALIPCALGLVALAACGLGLTLERLRNDERVPEPLLRVPAWSSAAATAFAFLTLGSRGAADFSEPDTLDELTRRQLPARAVVLTYDPGTIFRHLGAEAEEHLRPDVTLVPLAFAGFPGLADRIAMEHPELAPVLREQVLHGKLALTSLQSLSSERPLFLELSENVATEVYGSLSADRWFHRVLADGAGASELHEAEQRHLSALERAGQSLPVTRTHPELELRLARVQFFHALAAAAQGDLPSAQSNLELALGRSPADAGLLRLRSALPPAGKLAPEAVLSRGAP
jgi:hypothetical protein